MWWTRDCCWSLAGKGQGCGPAERKQGGGRGAGRKQRRAVRGSGAGRDSTARVLGPQTLPESCLLRQPRQGAPSCGGDSC